MYILFSDVNNFYKNQQVQFSLQHLEDFKDQLLEIDRYNYDELNDLNKLIVNIQIFNTKEYEKVIKNLILLLNKNISTELNDSILYLLARSYFWNHWKNHGDGKLSNDVSKKLINIQQKLKSKNLKNDIDFYLDHKMKSFGEGKPIINENTAISKTDVDKLIDILLQIKNKLK